MNLHTIGRAGLELAALGLFVGGLGAVALSVEPRAAEIGPAVRASEPAPEPATMSISGELRQCIERAQGADKAGHFDTGRRWWEEATRVVYGHDCRDSLEELPK